MAYQLNTLPPTVYDTLSAKSQECVKRLVAYGQQHGPIRWPEVEYPFSKFAAVLLILFEGARGELEVIVTTRSSKLRSHGGQTALPGGKADPGEANPVVTAFREAFEEIGLPPATRDQNVHVLASLPPAVSLHKLLVVPVIALLTDIPLVAGLQATISQEEVEALFVHPLESMLDPDRIVQPGVELAEKGGKDWPYEEELYNSNVVEWPVRPGWNCRNHRFRSTHSPVKGFTADLLITTAEIAFSRTASFERGSPNQPPMEQMIEAIVEDYHQTLKRNPVTSAAQALLAASSHNSSSSTIA